MILLNHPPSVIHSMMKWWSCFPSQIPDYVCIIVIYNRKDWGWRQNGVTEGRTLSRVKWWAWKPILWQKHFIFKMTSWNCMRRGSFKIDCAQQSQVHFCQDQIRILRGNMPDMRKETQTITAAKSQDHLRRRFDFQLCTWKTPHWSGYLL